MNADHTGSDRRNLLAQALRAVEEMKARLKAAESASVEPIAIVGAACRFPGGANNLESYWQLLRARVDAVSEIPPGRFGEKHLAHSDVAWSAGLLDSVDRFDPAFFRISPREALTMDPQQRLLLEIAWEALENAGQAPDGLEGSPTGVFVGITTHDYADLIHESGGDLLDVYMATGNAHNAAAGRLSFTLGLQGPSVAVDTACSSSLVSIHLACQSLRSGECRMALAGGVNALLSAAPFICFSRWGMMAPGGRCKAFDAGADGFVRAEGCGMVVLKRLSDAAAAGDRILAVIRGSAVNQDGRSSGITAPNGAAQEAVIRQALAHAGVSPLDISYVEAHGTGTSLGDPIEAHALASVLGPGRAPDNPLILGSVKTNLGHLESAAGVAGLIKVVLSLQHRFLPSHLHFRRWNPQIDWQGMPVEIPVQGRSWSTPGGRRLAGVSSFGFSGTNAHIILEEAPPPAPRIQTVERHLHLCTVSARSAAALEKLVGSYRDRLPGGNEDAGDFCFTANTGRAHFAHRAAFTGGSREELAEAMSAPLPAAEEPGDGRVAFLFTGQGAQYAGMGRELHETQPVFRRALDECAELLRGHRSEALIEVLWGSATALLDRTEWTQPALFALEYALAELWKSWGVEPAAVLGHSVGEYAALSVAGCCSLPDAIALIAERARRMQQLPGAGAMAAIEASEAEALEAIGGLAGKVSVAAVNGPRNVVIAGEGEEFEEVCRLLEERGVKARRLAVSHAFHSPQMEPMQDGFAAVTGKVRWREPRRELISSVTGEPAGAGELGRPEYWRRQVREAVRFQRGMETLWNKGIRHYVEIGPGSTLLGMARQCVPEESAALWLVSQRRGSDGWRPLLESVGRIYRRGAEIDWTGFDAPYVRRRVTLPTYPFERQRYWIDSALSKPAPAELSLQHPLLGRRADVASAPGTHIWENEMGLDSLPWLADHRVQGVPLFPATGYIEMAAAAGKHLFGDSGISLTELKFRRPLFLTSGARYTTQVILAVESADCSTVRIYSRPALGGSWTLHATGKVAACAATPEISDRAGHPEFAAWASREVSSSEFYSFFASHGNDWGPAFQGSERIWLRGLEAWSEIVVPPCIRADLTQYLCHPALADASGHLLNSITVFGDEAGHDKGALVGGSIDRLKLYRRPCGSRLTAYARLAPQPNAHEFRGSLRVYDEDGSPVSELEGAHLRYLEVKPTEAASPESWVHRVVWKNLPVDDAAAAQPTSWIVLADRSGFGCALAATISDAGIPCEGIVSGLDEGLRCVEAAARRNTPVSIACLWPLDIEAPAAATASLAISAVAHSNGVLDLLQKIARSEAVNLRVWFITRGAQDAGGSSEINFWQAPVWGLGRAFAFEHTANWGGLIDLDPVQSPESCARALWKHLAAPGGEDQVALRAADRLAARLERVPAPPPIPVNLRPDGAYLITGGLDGLGLEIARWMVEHGAHRLILMARTPLPPRETWAEISSDHSSRRAIDAICALEREGASITTLAMDIADRSAVLGFLNDWRRGARPPIRGIVSSAGVLHHASIADMRREDFETVLRPKVGAWILHGAFAQEPLDFCVFFSSASAVLNSPKLGGYAAANLFLDALAQHRNRQGQAGTSIQWGMWVGAGMTARAAAAEIDSLREHGMGAIEVEQGTDLLGRLMHEPGSVAVLPNDWHKWAARYPAYSASPMVSGLLEKRAIAGPDGTRSGFTRADLSKLPGTERLMALTDHLSGTLGSILGFRTSADTSIGIDQLGLDSLMALEFKNRIEADFSIVLPVVRLLQGPSLFTLAAELLDRLGNEAPEKPAELIFEHVNELSEAELDGAIEMLLAEGLTVS